MNIAATFCNVSWSTGMSLPAAGIRTSKRF